MHRRGFLFGLASSVAAAPVMSVIKRMQPAMAELVEFDALSAQIAAITRKAFIPSVYVQIYQSHPVLTYLQGRDWWDDASV